MIQRLCTIAAVVMFVGGLAFAQEKVAMKQTYAPGHFEIKMTVNSEGQRNMTVDAATQPAVEQKMTMAMTVDLAIGEPDKAGVKKASLSYRHIAETMTSGASSMVYDSDDANTAAERVAAALKPLLSAKISFEIAADGNLQNLKGMEVVWDAMVKGNPRIPPAEANMKKDFGIEQIQNLVLSRAADYLPPGAVAAGEAWTADIKTNAPLLDSVNLKTACKLTGIEKTAAGRQALIDFDGKGGIDKPTETKAGGTTVTVEKMSATQRGRFTFDLGRSMCTAAKVTGDMASEMTALGPNGQKITNVIKQAVQSEVTITPVAAGAAAAGGATSAPAAPAAGK